MTAPRDPDRMIRAFLAEGSERLADPVYDAVRAEIDSKRQRVVIGPWRMPIVNKLVPIALGAAAVVAVFVVGGQVLPRQDQSPGAATPPPAPTAAPDATPAAPSASAGAPGGTVQFQMDGTPATTEVDLVSDGAAGISGTAVTTLAAGTHTVRLECAVRDGDLWAVAGTVEQSTADASAANAWSAVIVKEGSPQQVAIWLSEPKADGSDCAGWLAGISLAGLTPDTFAPVTSGALVPPPAAP